MKRIWVVRSAKILSLLIAVILFVEITQNYYCRYFDQNQLRLEGFYLEDKDSLDVVLLGASEVYVGFSSAAAYEKFGFTSYPYAFAGNPASLWKWELREITKKQKPKVLVVEVNGALYDSCDLHKEAAARYFIDNMPMSVNKIETIQKTVQEDRLSYYIPLVKYHSKWTRIRSNLIGAGDTLLIKLRGHTLLKGIFTDTLQQIRGNSKDVSGDDAEYELDAEAEQYLKEFIQECQNNKIENVLFVRFPHRVATDYEYKRFRRCNRMEKIVEENGYDFINLEKDMDNLGFDTEKDFYNDDHLNVYGQKKLTAYLGKYLMDEYSIIPRKLTEKQQREWEESAEYIQLYYQYYDAYTKRENAKPRKMRESMRMIMELEELKKKGENPGTV